MERSCKINQKVYRSYEIDKITESYLFFII